MAALLQYLTSSNGGGNTSLASPSVTLAVGDFVIIAMFIGNGTQQVVNTMTDGLGNTYTLAAGSRGFDASTDGGTDAEIWYGFVTNPGTTTITATWTLNTGGYALLQLARYSGVLAVSPYDSADNGNGSTGSTISVTVPNGSGPDLIVCAVQVTTSGWTWNPGIVDQTGAGGIGLGAQLAGSAGPTTFQATGGAAGHFVGTIAAFKNAAAVGPVITGLSASLYATQPLTITGTGFGASQGASTVSINGAAPASISSWSNTSIVCIIPCGSTPNGVVTVTTSVGVSNGYPYAVGPSIPTFSPSSGPEGTNVTITGCAFDTTQGVGSVNFNLIAAPIISWSQNSIVCQVPSGLPPGNCNVNVSTAEGNNQAITDFDVTPFVSSLSPGSGPIGTPVIVGGDAFGSTQGGSTITVGGIAATVSTWSDTAIHITIPAGVTDGSAAIVVTVGGSPSNSVTFFVTPQITGLSVSSGPVGTPVTITGNNFGASQGTSTVTVNGVAATPSAWSDTSISITIPAGATTGNIVVTVIAAGASNGEAFTVTPTISSLSETSGHIGDSLTITGQAFGASQGSSTVKFNGVTATVTAWGNTSITVTVPASTTGNVVVTTTSGASNGELFTYLAPIAAGVYLRLIALNGIWYVTDNTGFTLS